MVEQRRANLDHRRDRRLSAFRAEKRGGDVRQTSVCRGLIAELRTRDKLKFVGPFDRRELKNG